MKYEINSLDEWVGVIGVSERAEGRERVREKYEFSIWGKLRYVS